MPPPTETTPVDLGYHDALQGQTTPAAKAPEPAAPAEDAPAARGAAATPPLPPAPVAAPRTVSDRPATSAPAGRPWSVQVGAFRSRENADRQVTQLKGKGFPAYADPPGAAGALVKVFVGPYSDRAEADRVAGRLQREQGLRPLVTR
jgi:DedD protein